MIVWITFDTFVGNDKNVCILYQTDTKSRMHKVVDCICSLLFLFFFFITTVILN